AGLLRQPEQRRASVSASEHEARAERAETRHERGERAVQRPARRAADGTLALGCDVEDVDGDQRAPCAPRVLKRRGEGGVGLEAEVLAEPEKGGWRGQGGNGSRDFPGPSRFLARNRGKYRNERLSRPPRTLRKARSCS